MSRFAGGKSRFGSWMTLPVVLASVFAFVAMPSEALDNGVLPSGGTIVAGTGSISTSGSSMTVIQATDRMVTDWVSFNIGRDASVNFLQPGASSIALNRITDQNPSRIMGSLSANGNVFLLNPSGILFGATAQVNVGALVASSLNLSNEDFFAGRYAFENSGGAGTVVNQGNIRTPDGGYVAFLGPIVKNEGTITADKGSVVMAAADKVRLDFSGDGMLGYSIEKGAMDALAENNGLIRADGGMVVLTAGAADSLTKAVVNNEGIIEARTLENASGRILLMGDMDHGIVVASGTLDASAPQGGPGGFIETSAAHVSISEDLRISAGSNGGIGGLWLIDPYNYTINGAAAGTISTALEGGTSVTIDTASDVAGYGSSGDNGGIGDITVSSAITKTAGNTDVTLTLKAANSIIVDEAITNSGGTGKLNVVLDADNTGGVGDGAGIVLLNNDITTNGGSLSFGTGRTATIGGVSTLVGGDVYVAGAGARTLSTNGGNVDVKGEMILANTSGLTINSNNGNIRFYGMLNSGNTYSFTSGNVTWTAAVTAAASGAGDGVGDTYLATITSRLENAIAARAGNYAAAWLGGERLQGVGTDWTWRWVTGPEGLEDSHGRAYFTQTTNGTGGTAVNGAYSNWNGGEPNGSGTGAGVGEQCLQFTGTVGQWNDLTSGNTGAITGYITETNLAASPLTVNAGSGSVTFSGAVGTSKALASLDVTTTGGIAINGGAVTTEGAQVYSDNITLGSSSTMLTQTSAGTDFTLHANKSITNATGADAGLTIKSTRDIVMAAGSSINSSTGKLDTVLWADSDATGGGCIQLGMGSPITTNGGDLWLGGGSGSTTWNGLTVGDGYAVGRSTGTGIFIGTGAISTSGGDIAMYGKSAVNGITTANPDGVNWASGIYTVTGNGSNVSINSGTGTILLDAVCVLQQNWGGEGLYLNGGTITSSATSGDAITLIGDASLADYGAGTRGAGVTLVGWDATRPVSITANGGGNIRIEGTSTSTATSVGLNYGLRIATAGAGTCEITTTGGTGNITLSGTANDTGASYSVGVETASTTLSSSGNLSVTGSGKPVLLPGEIDVTGTASFSAAGQDITATNTSNDFGGAVSVLFAKNFGLVDSNAMTLGAINSTGTVDIATLTGDLTLAGAIVTTDATSAAITLNAGKTTTAGTASGGNIIVSGGTVSTGAGGRATLFSGGVSDTTLAALVGSGSGRFRYNSDETTSNYTTALGSGACAVYREQPTVTITAENDIKNYDGLGYSGDNGIQSAGYVNGDTSSILGGTAVFGGTSQGAVDADSYSLTVSGLTNGLGYALSYADGSLTVSPAPLTITASDVTKIYGETLTLTAFSSVGLQNGESIGSVSLTSAGTSATAGVAGGPYAITAVNAVGGTFDPANYTITYNSGGLTVTPAPLTVTATDVTKTYGETPTLSGFSSVGLLNGESIGSVSLISDGTSATAGVAGGPYAITAADAGGGTFDPANYTITYNSGGLTVTPVSLTVTANDDFLILTGDAYHGGNGVTYSGFVNGETSAVLTGTLIYGGTSQGAMDVGSYSIVPSGFGGTNYNISYSGGTLTILPLPPENSTIGSTLASIISPQPRVNGSQADYGDNGTSGTGNSSIGSDSLGPGGGSAVIDGYSLMDGLIFDRTGYRTEAEIKEKDIDPSLLNRH
jgi:filamentous hemagglutinin family protein